MLESSRERERDVCVEVVGGGFPVSGSQFHSAGFDLPLAEAPLLVLDADLAPQPRHIGVLAEVVPTKPPHLLDRGRRRVVPHHRRRVRGLGLYALLLLRFLWLYDLIDSVMNALPPPARSAPT
ncbi:hypothetical protein Acr_00g0060190 [Actinidia rufa]|uniref:Uncharacterized protein n=1 Tax=Actinidia rufa TaxID=165716 RepID=A0A7J0DNA7_9ERIC|nr:hypothetical protein Acr_00g0060190 [Actinidia rufa]